MVSTRIYLPYMARSNNTPAIITSTKFVVDEGGFFQRPLAMPPVSSWTVRCVLNCSGKIFASSLRFSDGRHLAIVLPARRKVCLRVKLPSTP